MSNEDIEREVDIATAAHGMGQEEGADSTRKSIIAWLHTQLPNIDAQHHGLVKSFIEAIASREDWKASGNLQMKP